MKKLINVLWAIEKDLHVIASNVKASESETGFRPKNKRYSVTISSKCSGTNELMDSQQIALSLQKIGDSEKMVIRTHE